VLKFVNCRYFAKKDPLFHSVIYKASDVSHPSDSSGCKSHELHLKRKESSEICSPSTVNDWRLRVLPVKNKSFKSPSRAKRDATFSMQDLFFERLDETRGTIRQGSPVVFMDDESAHSDRRTVTTFEVLDWADVPESVRHHFRKRANLKSRIDPKKKTCMLYLQADHLFYEKMGSEEASIDAMTRHVQRVNSIYKEIGNYQ
jgi:disintegrin and metalloproteinase domain-containing protein 10